MSEIQAILLPRTWTAAKSNAWLKRNGFHPIKAVHITANYRRYRIREPKGKMRIIKLGEDVKAIIMFS